MRLEYPRIIHTLDNYLIETGLSVSPAGRTAHFLHYGSVLPVPFVNVKILLLNSIFLGDKLAWFLFMQEPVMWIRIQSDVFCHQIRIWAFVIGRKW